MTPCPATSPPPPRPTAARPPHRPAPQARRQLRLAVAGLLVTAVALSAEPALAQSAPPRATGDGVDTALAYCTNLADQAADARFARKAAKLKELEAEVSQRLAALEDKRREYEEWLGRRQRFLDRAQERLVSIYTGMQPDAASRQLAAMDELTAAAIVARLAPRAASAVLNEMETQKAARLATIMSGLGRKNDERGA